jgi:bacterioferritin-associated ferredoxin
MLVCNCRGINEKQVKVAVRAGATDWAEVHSHYGTEPSCGKCSCEIQEVIAAYSFRENESDSAPFFGTPALAKPA